MPRCENCFISPPCDVQPASLQTCLRRINKVIDPPIDLARLKNLVGDYVIPTKTAEEPDGEKKHLPVFEQLKKGTGNLPEEVLEVNGAYNASGELDGFWIKLEDGSQHYIQED